jgi:hypothetical protein
MTVDVSGDDGAVSEPDVTWGNPRRDGKQRGAFVRSPSKAAAWRRAIQPIGWSATVCRVASLTSMDGDTNPPAEARGILQGVLAAPSSRTCPSGRRLVGHLDPEGVTALDIENIGAAGGDVGTG